MLAGGFTINCDIIVPDKANGALVATGSNLGGWSFALRNGRPIATHAASSAEADQFSIQASAPLPAGTQHLGFVFIPARKRVVYGKRVSVRVSLGGRLFFKTKILLT